MVYVMVVMKYPSNPGHLVVVFTLRGRDVDVGVGVGVGYEGKDASMAEFPRCRPIACYRIACQGSCTCILYAGGLCGNFKVVYRRIEKATVLWV